MVVDDIIKLLLAISVSISLVGISWQIARLIGKVADSLQDLRKALQNISTATDLFLEDYNDVRKVLRKVLNIFDNLGTIAAPFAKFSSFLAGMAGKGKEDDEEIEEVSEE